MTSEAASLVMVPKAPRFRRWRGEPPPLSSDVAGNYEPKEFAQ